ncbi:MAG TPA: disulfide oxidoreductase [Spirochaetota bacterium]|nr:disulfide oxidoreductase [Spirochaetota bacterium]HNT10806.1 disulfide oxidoreductase [Spirochaetota bacterium]HNV49096.1 disulfide oxidoreductase [Spirochaetota bacterium]HOS41521.1 disulfide oxidoreductase [Spirochaetota bacterium]HPU90515.1 disulfide oxidoreductase [Spirochaetota bacterium]
MKIKETTTVEEAIKKGPRVVEVFQQYRLDCPSCRGLKEDTIRIVAVNNGLDLKKLLDDLNAAMS